MKQFWFQIFASTFIPEVAALMCSVEKVSPAAILKRGSIADVFSVNIARFLRTPFSIGHL